MRTVLVVEDEKAIRQGIAAMVRRAGVPVERVVECRNGREALAAAEELAAEVVFTDLRMPKMDGFELVRHLQQLPEPPLMVVISGHDDFAHAVEMLRMGVRDYLLKPVDRHQVAAILQRFEEELARRARAKQGMRAAAVQVARALMQGDDPGADAADAMADQYGQLLFAGRYRVACLHPGYAPPPGLANAADMGLLEGHRVLLVADGPAPALGPVNAGFSAVQSGLGGLRPGFLQARRARWTACLLGRSFTHGEAAPAAGSPKAAAGQVGQIIQLLGRGNAAEARRLLGELLLWAQNGLLPPEAFATAIAQLLEGLAATYAAFPDIAAQLEVFRNCWQMDSAYQYYEALGEWMEAFAARLADGEDNQSQRRIHDAVQYLGQHYAEEINMAVVSNQVSMNYSQFSSQFKRYTGQNFQDYLRGLRLQRARQLLEETDLGVREVGTAVGFKNEKHFMKAFKAATAVSPSDYRRNHIKGGRG